MVVILHLIKIGFLFSPLVYQYAMKEGMDSSDEERSYDLENRESAFGRILSVKKKKLGEVIEKEKSNIMEKITEMKVNIKDLEKEKNNLETQQYAERYQKLKEYVSGIGARVIKKMKK